MMYIAYTLELQRTCTKLSPWQGNDGNPKSAKTKADGLDGCGSSWDGNVWMSGTMHTRWVPEPDVLKLCARLV